MIYFGLCLKLVLISYRVLIFGRIFGFLLEDFFLKIIIFFAW
jgi:hypothetical protein